MSSVSSACFQAYVAKLTTTRTFCHCLLLSIQVQRNKPQHCTMMYTNTRLTFASMHVVLVYCQHKHGKRAACHSIKLLKIIRLLRFLIGHGPYDIWPTRLFHMANTTTSSYGIFRRLSAGAQPPFHIHHTPDPARH